MFKKKSSILLLLLLALFSIGLFSTSYAVTESEFKNLIYNSLIYNNNMTSSNAENIINNQFDSKFASVSQYFNDNYYIIFTRDSANSTEINAWVCSVDNYGSSSHSTYNVSSSQLSACGDACRIRVTYSSDTLNILLRYRNNAENVTPFVYATTQTIFGNSNATIINHSADNDSPYYSSDWFTFSGPYSDYFDKFEFSPNSTNFEICSINGLVEPSQVYVYERTNQNYLTLGYLEKFSNLDNITITRYRYTKSNGWVETSVNAFDDFSGYNVQDDILTYTIDVSKISADTLVLFNFTPNNIEDFTNQTFALYVKSPYTVISNGVIYPAQIFSGDYYNNYNDDSNTDKIVDNNKSDSDKIVDTLTDDSQVDGMLAEFVSGDAEDIAKKFGFSLFNRYYYDFIHDTIEDIVEVLEDEGDVYFDYSMHGEVPTRIYASQFTTPNGTLKTFLSMFLISCTVFAFYKYIADIIELISTGNVLEALREFNVDRNIFKM